MPPPWRGEGSSTPWPRLLPAQSLEEGGGEALDGPLSKGQPLPATGGHDLHGDPHWLAELLGPGNTLIMVLSDPGTDSEMDAWMAEARERLPPGATLLTVLSLRTPFFVSEGFVRGLAKKDVPEEEWSSTLLDADGHMAEELGLKPGLPWAIVVGPDTRIRAAMQGRADSAGAEEIWEAWEGEAASPDGD